MSYKTIWAMHYNLVFSIALNSRSSFKMFIRQHRPIKYEIKVPRSNPPIRTRHNKVNAQICNANGLRRLFVYRDAPTVDEGLRMTKLKPGAQYIEDDSNHFQYITTALGYKICGILSEAEESTGVYSFRR